MFEEVPAPCGLDGMVGCNTHRSAVLPYAPAIPYQSILTLFLRTRVCITIDTEFSIGGAFFDAARRPIAEPLVWRNVDGRSEGLGFMLETLRKNRVRADFFVETVQHCYFKNDPIAGPHTRETRLKTWIDHQRTGVPRERTRRVQRPMRRSRWAPTVPR